MSPAPSTLAAAPLLQLPPELLQAVLDKLSDACSLVMLEHTHKIFRSVKPTEGDEALSWTESVARKKVLELRRHLQLPGHSISRSAVWLVPIIIMAGTASFELRMIPFLVTGKA